MGLSFGHWEIFKLLINGLRDIEKNQTALKLYFDSLNDGQEYHSFSTNLRQKSTMEKQVRHKKATVDNEKNIYLLFLKHTHKKNLPFITSSQKCTIMNIYR